MKFRVAMKLSTYSQVLRPAVVHESRTTNLAKCLRNTPCIFAKKMESTWLLVFLADSLPYNQCSMDTPMAHLTTIHQHCLRVWGMCCHSSREIQRSQPLGRHVSSTSGNRCETKGIALHAAEVARSTKQ